MGRDSSRVTGDCPRNSRDAVGCDREPSGIDREARTLSCQGRRDDDGSRENESGRECEPERVSIRIGCRVFSDSRPPTGTPGRACPRCTPDKRCPRALRRGIRSSVAARFSFECRRRCRLPTQGHGVLVAMIAARPRCPSERNHPRGGSSWPPPPSSIPFPAFLQKIMACCKNRVGSFLFRCT